MRRALVATVVVSGFVHSATATPYESFIDVGDQQDLEDLLAAGDITADTFTELLELLGAGVDLSTADRAELYTLPNLTYDDVDAIIAYRETAHGVIRDPADLVRAGALTEDKLLAISAFLTVTEPRDKYGVKGWIRGQTRWSTEDDRLPPFALRGRFAAFKHARAGFATTFTRLDPGPPRYDPARDALIADPTGYKLVLPKAYIKYEDEEASAIAGTFRIGFGQRLVFDNSSRYTPNGIYIDDDLTFSQDLTLKCKESAGELAETPCSPEDNVTRITPDWRWRDGLLGVAAGFKHLELGSGWLQGYTWASAVKRKVYQYELVDRGKCKDPSDDADPACSAPNVFVTPEGDVLASTSKFKFTTLPDVFQERVVGANVAYFADRRNSVGLTAYGAQEANLVDGIDLDTQEWSSIPTGRKFGAAGANFSFGRSWLDIFGEAAFSYDQMPDAQNAPQSGGGGPAAIVRVTATRKKEELEAVFRYYGIDFVNPFARPISQPDTLDGQRARDELGFRLRYYKTTKLYSVRALLDLWESPSQRDATQLGRQQPKLDTYVRTDVRTSDEIRLGLWFRYQDKDLRVGGKDQCFEVSTEFDENGEPIPCGGRQLTTIGRMQYIPSRFMSYTVMLEHQLLDDPSLFDTGETPEFRQDLSAWLIALWSPQPGVRIRGRARYLNEDIKANDRLEDSLSVVLDTALKVRGKDTIRVRGDLKWFLDKRTSTIGDTDGSPLPRNPNPELQVWLSYEARL